MDHTASDTLPSGANNTEASSGRTSALKDRGKWANKTEFRLAMAGLSIGMSNLWYLSPLCHENGGGAFLLLYLVILFFCGMPVFFLETALGQYTGEGGVTSWRKICPMFQGIGIASQITVMYWNVCSIVYLAWALFYLYNSFKNPLPWSRCDNPWNTNECWSQSTNGSDWSFLHNNSIDYEAMDNNSTWFRWHASAEEEFWNARIGREYMSKPGPGGFNWELALCLLLAWVACYFCIRKGVKYIGKVFYFTVAFPFLLLVILFIRGVSLPGAWEGIKYFLYVDFSKIADEYVWYGAMNLVFYNLATSHGVLTVIGSYNEYKYDCYNDCLVFCALSSVMTVFSGLATFSLLGFVVHDADMSLEDFLKYDIRLIFISYPKVFSVLPGAQFWAVLFFLLVFLVGFNQQVLCVDSFVTTVTDMFPHTLRRPRFREILVLITVVVCFLLSLLIVTEKGLTVFWLMDSLDLSGNVFLLIAGFEAFVIGWIYGANRFYDNIEDMIGYQPFPVIKYCWLFVIPILLSACVIINAPVSWSMFTGPGSTALSYLLKLAPIMCIPVFIFVAICENRKGITTPASDLRQACPHKPRLTLCKKVISGGHKSAHKPADEERPTAESSTGL
ncbi:hypothetical protein AAFF_G00076460 [Aldrovandia affinis]|uniref:Uncharacterized protein n=1 Tax=Aldrovandia affinis TaxID=143900 RepID=A0AAD7RXR7_9TELE|nr:hypothetical protein AAFF_G00076460 [Aldrovandia affinis]